MEDRHKRRQALRLKNRAIRRRNRIRLTVFTIVCLVLVVGLVKAVGMLPFFNKTTQTADAKRSAVGGDDLEAVKEKLPGKEKSQDKKNVEEKESEKTSGKDKKQGFSNKIQKFLKTKQADKIYSSTNELSDLVTEIPMGSYIESYGNENGWTKVNFKNQHGYMKSDVLEPIDTENQFKVVDGILIVNDKYSLPKDFEPDVNQEAMQSYELMKQQMQRLGMDIAIISDFRSYDKQDEIYKEDLRTKGKEYVDNYTAKPGHSEHQTGLAFDFYLNNGSKTVNDDFDGTKEAEWLGKNSYKYGFILRFPRGKQDITGYAYESWHFRYVGAEAAQKIYESGLTIEEYYGL